MPGEFGVGREPWRTGLQNTVREALAHAESHLSFLSEERARVRMQIRNLRRLEEGLAMLGMDRWNASADAPVDAPTVEHDFPNEAAAASAAALTLHHCDRNPELKRACRIALLETHEPETVQQIVARIEKRGSFSFGEGARDSAGAVEAELDWMVLEGEACSGYVENTCRWWWRREQRKAP